MGEQDQRASAEAGSSTLREHGAEDLLLWPDTETGTSGPRPAVPGWTVERVLGRGGSSTVWLAHADDGGAPAAVKVPRGAVETSMEVLEHELRAVGELHHDHLARPLGVVVTDQGPGLLSEYFPGGSLGALVRAAGPLPLQQTVTVLVPIAQVLGALHGRGVVHGDVSPGNVLFTLEGRPALSDLGASRLLGGRGHRSGTPGFTAPEVTDPAGSVGLDPAADVYSLAAVGWYALTGRAPAPTAARAPLPLTLPEIPAAVVQLLEAGLAESPSDRPTAELFASACYRWADPEPVDLYASAHPAVALELPTRRPPADRRRRVRRRADRARRREHAGPRRGVHGVRRKAVLWSAGLLGAAAVTGAAALVLSGGAPSIGLGQDPSVAEVPVTGPPPASGPSVGTGSDTRFDPDPAAAPDTAPAAGTAPAAEDSATPPVPALDVEDPAEAVIGLAPARAHALTSRQDEDVTAYAVSGSAAHRGDLELIAELRERGLRYDGLELQTRALGPVTTVEEATMPSGRTPAAGPAVRVPVELTIGPHRTVDGQDRVLSRAGEAQTERFTVEMVRTDHGWRAVEILAD